MDKTLADPLVGAVLEGRYRIRGQIARGGMATVYDALDERLERTVAVKVMHPGYASNQSFVTRFIQEARSAAALSHPNVVAVFDQGVHQGLAFLVMELVPGRTLRDLLTARGRLPAADAVSILEPVLDALAAAHAHGMVHRDVKPENVLLGNDGRVKVADFGLARATANVGPTSTRGVVMGTVAYVSPEQITHGRADTRSDVYSAGIMLFEMLTGNVPYGGDSSVNIAFQHVHSDVPPPSSRAPGVPSVLDDLTRRATWRDPNGRPADAGAFLAELRAARGAVAAAETRVETRPTTTATATASVPVPAASGPATAIVPRGAASVPTGGPGRAAARRAALAQAKSPQHNRNRVALIASLVALAVLAAGVGWYVGVGRFTETPNLLNLNEAQAIDRASQVGLKVRFTKEFDETALKNRVFKQVPKAGDNITDDGEIVAVISKGPERIAVPQITNVTLDAARGQLEKAGLKIGRTDEKHSSDVEKGKVIRSVPAPGEQVKRDTSVILEVSKGPGVKLPDMVGKTREEAETTLRELGLTVDSSTVQTDDPSKQGTVLSQAPAGGEGVEVAPGSEVKLSIAQGQAQVTVPDVNGQEFDDAKDQLEELGLKVKRRGGGRGGDARVLFQFPGAGSQVAAGTEITLFVG